MSNIINSGLDSMAKCKVLMNSAVKGLRLICSLIVGVITNKTTNGGNYSDVLPLKAARRDSISNLTSFGASSLSCRRTQCRFI